MRTGLSIALFMVAGAVAAALAAACGDSDETALRGTTTPAPTRLVYPRPTATATAYVTPLPLAERATGPLIVQASSNYNFEIYRVNPDGSNLANLTNHPAAEWLARWAGGSQRISFTSYRDGQGGQFTMAEDGSDVRQNPGNVPDGAAVVSWSPGGSKLLYGFFTEGGTGEYWTMNADGSGRTLILPHCANCSIQDWSPDGSRLVGYQQDDNDNAYLFTIARDGSDLRRLAEVERWSTFARWSPLGNAIAFSSRDLDTNLEVLWLVNPDTGDLRRLYSRQDLRRFDWSPDGNALAVTTERQLLIVDAASGEAPTLAQARGGTLFGVAWSPNGGHIAYVSSAGSHSDVYVVPAAGGEPVNVSDGPWSDHDPQWSPDGSFLLFRSDRDSLDGIYAINLDGSEQERLIALPPGALTTEEAEAIELPEVLGDCGEEFFVPGFRNLRACRAQDRLHVAFVRGFEDLDNVQVVVRNIVVGEARIVPTHGYVPEERLVAWAPDSASIALYGSQDGERWLYVLRLDDGSSRRLARGDDVGMHADLLWSPDGEYVYYTQGTECRGGCTPGHLYRIRADGSGEPERMSDLRITTLYGFQP